MTNPFAITTQLKCPNCGQTGIFSQEPDQQDDVTGAHTSGFRQDGAMAVCSICSHAFPIEAST